MDKEKRDPEGGRDSQKGKSSGGREKPEKDGTVSSGSACLSMAHTYVLSSKLCEGQGCPRFDDLLNLHR